MKKIILSLFVVAIAAANLLVGQTVPTTSDDLTLQNIEIVGLSAAESTCDASNDNLCEITAVGKATGKLIYIN